MYCFSEEVCESILTDQECCPKLLSLEIAVVNCERLLSISFPSLGSHASAACKSQGNQPFTILKSAGSLNMAIPFFTQKSIYTGLNLRLSCD